MDEVQYIVVVRLGLYLKFYGPFAEERTADLWGLENIANGHEIIELYGVQTFENGGPPRTVRRGSKSLIAPGAYRWDRTGKSSSKQPPGPPPRFT